MGNKYSKESFSDVEAAFEVFKEYLLANFDDVKLAAGGREIVKRCHYCGDSRDPSSKHLYIGIDKTGVISYHCFKCNYGGPILYKFFREIGIYDVDLINTVIDANNKSLANPKVNRNYHEKSFYRVPPKILPSFDGRAQKKLAYINRRLGQNLSMEDMSKLKIVLNIKDYLAANNVRYYARKPEIIDEMDLGFMGFLSVDNSHIVMRRLVPEDKVHPSLRERYNIYSIYSKTSGVNYYVIPGTIDPNRPCNIIMAEGQFDLLSVYLNLPRYDNAIYCCPSGKAHYDKLLKFVLLQIKVPYFGANIHIYSDNDINNRDLNALYYLAYDLQLPCYLHFNTFEGEKDFGITRDRIIDECNEFYKPTLI